MAKFSDNLINQRFRRIYEELENRKLIKGKSDVAKKLGTYNHVINSILKGQRNITVDQLHSLFAEYGVNANFLFGMEDHMFLPGFGDAAELPTETGTQLQRGGRQNITLVPEPALAGYAVAHQDGQYFSDLERFSIPHLEGDLIAFEISGDSMMPTITNGDLIVCEALQMPMDGNFPTVRDNHVYVIVTDTVVAKRIQQIKSGNTVIGLRLISDNSTVYQPYDLDLSEVKQILRVKCRLTDYAIS